MDKRKSNPARHDHHTSLRSYYASCAAQDLDLYDHFPRSSLLQRVDRYLATWVHRQAVRFLPRHTGTIIDMGCGSGGLIGHLLDHAPQSQVIGIDLSEELLRLARQRFKNCLFRQGDLCDLSVDLPAAQVVFCLGVINHFSDNVLHEVLSRLAKMVEQRLIVSFVSSGFIFSSRTGQCFREIGVPFTAHEARKVVGQLGSCGLSCYTRVYWLKIPFVSPIVVLVMDREHAVPGQKSTHG